MSRYFVTDGPVAIPEFDPAEVLSDRAPNIIWIKARMDIETKGRVTSELVTVGDKNAVEFRVGANEMALLIHNIIRWEGPDLSGVACTPENIRRLDPTDPHIARVLEDIAIRNKPKEAPSPNAPTANGSPNSGWIDVSPISAVVPVTSPSARGKPRSS